MTQKEKENVMCALSSIRSAISELEYYKKSGWLSDEGALHCAKSAEEFLKKCITKTTRKK